MELDNFDIDILKKKNLNFTMCICASRGEGKSSVVKFLYKKLKNKYDLVVLFSPTIDVDTDTNYRSVIDSDMMFDMFDEQVVNDLITMNKQRVKEGLDKFKILVILDDIINTRNIKVVEEIFCRGRHSDISIIIVSQHIVSNLTPKLRNNCEFLFCGKQKDGKAKRFIIENFMSGIVPSGKLKELGWYSSENFYEHVLQKYTRDRGDFIVIDKFSHTDDPYEILTSFNFKNYRK